MTARRRTTRRRLLQVGAVLGGTVVVGGIGTTAAYLGTRFPAAEPQSGTLVIRARRILAGADLTVLDHGSVVIRDGRIVAVDARVEPPAEAEVVELPDATLLPGLIDMHTHLAAPELDPGEELGPTGMPGFLWDATRYMPSMRRAMLAHGVTSVRSLGDELAWVLDLRDQVATDVLAGPRIFCAGPVLTTAAGHPISTRGVAEDSDTVRLPRTAAEAEAIVAELLDGERPVDLIKVIQESGTSDQPLGPHSPTILRAIAAAAESRGVPVVAHCGTTTDLTQVVEAGFTGVEHSGLRPPAARRGDVAAIGHGWPPGLLDQMAAAEMTLDPTMVVEWQQRAAASPAGAEARDRVRLRLQEAHEAGITILAGSDAAMPGVPFGSGLIQEVGELGAVLPVKVALQAATSSAARALGADQIGSIEVGRAADLLAVTGDPLADLSALREIQLVLRDGRQPPT